jgi:hypothetical protein
MAIIPQKQLFKWDEVEELGDLERLKLVIDYLPDEELMQALENERANGRNDYPVRAVWNSVLAGIVFQHPTIESLRRELSRNAQLRQVCGFDITLGVEGVPSSSAYTRFLRRLMTHQKGLDEMFDNLVRMLCDELPDFGETLAIDGKALESYAKPRRAESEKPYDGRRDIDANFGVKTYKGKNKDGSVWEKTMSWFGYKLHLIVDANYELPVAFRVTQASRSEIKEARTLVDEMALRLPSAFTLCARVPTALREPLGASVTFWEATAPVKLPTRECPPAGSRSWVRNPAKQGWYPNVGSTWTSAQASMPPTYPVHALPRSNLRLQ